MSFNTVFKAINDGVYLGVEEEEKADRKVCVEIGDLNFKVTRHTFTRDGLVGSVCISWMRWSQVVQLEIIEVDMVNAVRKSFRL